jgi:formate/nitrite transporter
VKDMSKHCQFWQDYDSIAGGISYCELAAFNKPVNPAFLAQIGCTGDKRKQCLGTMELNIGTGSVPTAVPAACDAPPDIARNCVGVAEKKAAISPPSLRVLGLLAGAYIAMGAVLSTVVTNDLAVYIGDGLSRLVGGVTFSLGLVLVVLGGAELFTGNNLVMTAGLLQKKITYKQVLSNWSRVYLFNFIGALLIVILIFYSGIWKFNGGSVGLRAVNIAAAKVSLPWSEAFFRGILCNWLVCLAVWLSLAGKDAFGKILAIVIPVTAFVAMGFEHSIANMYFIPMGILLTGLETVRATIDPAVVNALTWSGFLWKNLIPVTLGNVVGGVIFVAVAYWNAYLRPTIEKQVEVISWRRRFAGRVFHNGVKLPS